MAPPTRSRRKPCGSSAPKSSRSASSRTASTSTATSARPSPQALRDKVREMRADIGIALDGDADRVIIVDEHGHVDRRRPADGGGRARAGATRGCSPSPASSRRSCPISASSAISAALGLTLERTAVGDRYVIERMRRERLQCRRRAVGPCHPVRLFHDRRRPRHRHAGARRGQEARTGRVSEVCHRFEPLPQVLQECARARRARAGAGGRRRARSRPARARLGGAGRLVIRPSGTEPVIRVMGEGDDRELIETLVAQVCNALKRVC